MKNQTTTALVLALLFAVAPALRADDAKLNYALSLYSDEKGEGMKRPEGVACDNPAGVTVADSGNGRLLRYVLREGAVASTAEIRLPELSQPLVVRVGAQGALFVLDGKQRRILRLGADGAFKGYVEPAGVPGGAPAIIKSFALGPQGGLYVLDVAAGRVLVLDPDGKFQREVRVPGSAGFISDLAVDPRGTILLADSVNAEILSAAPGAAVFTTLAERGKANLGFPAAITANSRGTIYVLDRNTASVVILRQDGSVAGRQLGRGWKEGTLNYPSQLCVTASGEVFIADRGNNRVQMFTLAP